MCKKELYGETADEKEVAQIVSKLKEAKGVKAYDTFEIIAKYVSQSHLLNLILPLKDVSCSLFLYCCMYFCICLLLFCFLDFGLYQIVQDD